MGKRMTATHYETGENIKKKKKSKLKKMQTKDFLERWGSLSTRKCSRKRHSPCVCADV